MTLLLLKPEAQMSQSQLKYSGSHCRSTGENAQKK
jgi:hypothetical protein